MNTTCVCIYSHSSYKPLLDLVLYCLEKAKISFPVYIFRDTALDFPQTHLIQKVIVYNDSLPYAQKLHSCIDQLDEKYMILYQEKDMLFSYDEGRIQQILECMNLYTIATVDLHINQSLFNPAASDIMTQEEKDAFPTNFRNPDYAKQITLHFKDIAVSRGFDYLYSCGPRIWNLVCLRHILQNFPQKTYREIECQEVDRFMIENEFTSLKLAQGSNDKFIFAGRGFKMLDFFAWLSVSNYRKIIDDMYWGDFRDTMMKALENLHMTKEEFLAIQLQ